MHIDFHGVIQFCIKKFYIKTLHPVTLLREYRIIVDFILEKYYINEKMIGGSWQ